MAEVDSFSVVGSGLVGVELATELKTHFPDKAVNVFTRSDGWLTRVPGTHALVGEVCSGMGVRLHPNQDIVHTDEDGRVVSASGERLGDRKARTYWASGYRPNSSYLQDSRTDRGVAEAIDAGGFVRVLPTHQLPGLDHIFAAGDLTWAAAHAHGERTAHSATLHAAVVVENILRLAGAREGPLKRLALDAHPGLDALCVSLGTDAGLVYATDPNWEAFFQDKDGLRARYGELAAAGPAGWKEVTRGDTKQMGSVNWMKFSMFPANVAKWFREDDLSTYDQFLAPALVDVE